MSEPNPSDWWMFHGDPAHTGFTDESSIDSKNVGSLKLLYEPKLGGPILSTPAIADGYVYVGTANSAHSPGNNGGCLHKIALATGEIEKSFRWDIQPHEGDSHGFTGMGCTPAVVDGRVYFSAFDGKLYCLDSATLTPIWITNLRVADPEHGQPITNNMGANDYDPPPQSEGWCSPLVVGGRVYVGIGEGENPYLFAFLFCLAAETGDVEWIYCTCQFDPKQDNRPNVLPREVIDPTTLPGKFEIEYREPVTRGCAVWTAIAYDADRDRIFAATGNPTGESGDGPFLPAPGYAYGLLALDARTGDFEGFYQIDEDSSYRVSDLDVDFGAAPVLFERHGRTVVAAGCKNGGVFIVDADTMKCVCWRQILPCDTEGDQIPTVDPHGPDSPSDPEPRLTNKESNETGGENFHGTYSTLALHPQTKRLFIGSGGNNYHLVAGGIDYETTPFLRALHWDTLGDAWALDDEFDIEYVDDKGVQQLRHVMRYGTPNPPMYTTPGEAGLSSPAVVNDVVFCSTSRIALYAFDVKDGRLLWQDRLGNETGGFKGGYGYCLGPAVAGNYVVAGALVFGGDDGGGVLRIYRLG